MQAVSGTGINHWWRYQEESVPGRGRMMVNVGTGNLLVQDDDMVVPHKGIALAFRRTYNSQSLHDVNASDAGGLLWEPPGLYGNGWTNTFDAHLTRTIDGSVFYVYDIDGTRYDFTIVSNFVYAPVAGNDTTLTSDGNCGFLWAKKSGTSYYFYRPNPAAVCTNMPTAANGAIAGYAGRLYQIIGRNRNTFITFNYSWDNDDASATGKIAQIAVTTESGITATLAYGDVSGHRLLQQLTFPDSATSVMYGYDSAGNLTSVSRPPNNAIGARPQQTYGYQGVGAGSVLYWIYSPRLNASNPFGSDGSFLAFLFAGASAATATLTEIAHWAFVNPSIPDGSNSAVLQPGYPTGGTYFRYDYYATGGSTPTWRDTDGHATNWVVDSLGRVTQTQECTATVNQACTGTYLVTNEAWDANNNLISEVDPRGAETDAAYDAAGDLVALALPPEFQGSPRATWLFDYDSFNNLTAFCDPVETNPSGNWAGQYAAGSDSYCTALLGTANHARYGYTYPSYEPYGELTSTTTPSGYTSTITYDAVGQAGADYGLPTRIAGAQIAQWDPALPRTPSTSQTYDANGNVICAKSDSAGGAAAIMTYDVLNRLVSSADPDDASLTSPSCPKTAGIGGSAIVTTRTYYPDGSLATSRTPSEVAAAYGTVYSYDVDGNLTAEAPYQSSPQSPQTARIKRWYDGADRLVETQEPADPATAGDIPIAMRYIYDLSQGGQSTTLSGTAVTAHGNLFELEKNTQVGSLPTGTPTGWTAFKYSAFDALDRVITDFAFAPCPAITSYPVPAGEIYCSQTAFATQYDWDTSTLPGTTAAPGLLVATLDGLGQQRVYLYDQLAQLTSLNYLGDNGKTTPVNTGYDLNGRVNYRSFTNNAPSAQPGQNTVYYSYSPDGALSQINNSTLHAVTSYSYFPDDALAQVSATLTPGGSTTLVNQPALYRYNYRNDGALASEAFGVSSQSVQWSYTAGGRMTAATDFAGSPSITAQYQDGHGRLSSYTTPAGTYAGFSYDAQGRIAGYTDPYTAIDGETVSTQYNIRGDLISRTYQPAGGKPGFQYRNIQGILMQNTSDQYDGRTGAPLLVNNGGASYDAIGRLVGGLGTFSYDAESRLVSGDTTLAARANDEFCDGGGAPSPNPPTEVSYLYDGEGQLFQDTTRTGSTLTPRQWFWSAMSPLYTASLYSNGTFKAVNGFNADGIGSITSPGLTMTDNDFDGAIAGYHNSTGHSSWGANNPYRQWCVGFTDSLPASANYIGADSIPPTDGTSDGSLTVSSSGRGFLSTAMGFTTPDYSSATPYAGGQRSVSADCKYNHLQTGTLKPIGCVANKPPTWTMTCDADVAQCGHLQGSGDDPFGFRDPRPAVRTARPPQTTKSCNGSPQGFAIPPNAPGIPLAFDAGRANGWNVAAANANIWRGGTFDYQRYGLRGPNSGSNSEWIPASNVVVGVYMKSAGVPEGAMIDAGVWKARRAKEPTSWAALAADVPLWYFGWEWAAANCR